MINQPKVSVLLPVYNTKEEYLRASIESILKQTFTDFELLILNDASTDENVEKIIQSYSDRRILYHKNDSNLGISGSRNKLIKMAKGQYLAVMDHDDISLPERLEKQVKFMDEHLDYGVIGCWPGVVDRDGYVNQLPVDNKEIQETLTLMMCICHPAVMIRKSVIAQYHICYEAEYTPAEDYQIFARLLGKTKFYNIPEMLFKYRFHQTNTSKLYSDKIDEASIKIQDFIHRDNPELWAVVNTKAIKETKVKILNCSVISIMENRNKKEYRILGLPIIKLKSKKIMPWHKYMKKSLLS